MDQVADKPHPSLLFDATNEHGDVIHGFLPVTSQLLAEIRRLQTLCERFGLLEATVALDVFERRADSLQLEDCDMLFVPLPCEVCPEDDAHGFDYSYLTVDSLGRLEIEIDDGGGDTGSKFIARGWSLAQLAGGSPSLWLAHLRPNSLGTY